MIVAELEAHLFARFPRGDAETWDHVGLSAGDPEAVVNGVCCALDATEANVRAAAARGANVLLTHHPVYLKAPDCLAPVARGRAACGAAVWAAISLGVSIISLHTNLDRSRAARELLPALVGLAAESSLEFPDDPGKAGLGAICQGPNTSLGEFAQAVAAAFGTEPRVWGAAETPLTRVAFLGGSLGDFGELAVEQGAQAIVTGEAGYHVAQDLAIRGCAPILLGHDRSEEPFTTILADALLDAGLSSAHIDILKPSRQWWTATEGGPSWR